MPENGPNESPAVSQRKDVKRRTLPASEWHEYLEQQIAALSARRQELRRTIVLQKQERHANNPLGEVTLSTNSAFQLARSKIMGREWETAFAAVKLHAARTRSLRRQLSEAVATRRLTRERTARWMFWVVKAPYYVAKERPLRKRLRAVDRARRRALKTLLALRPAAGTTAVRAQIMALSESLLIKDERLKHSLEQLRGAEQSIGSQLTQALRMSAQMQALGRRPVTMEQRIDPHTRELSIPTPIESARPLPKNSSQRPKLRVT